MQSVGVCRCIGRSRRRHSSLLLADKGKGSRLGGDMGGSDILELALYCLTKAGSKEAIMWVSALLRGLAVHDESLAMFDYEIVVGHG